MFNYWMACAYSLPLSRRRYYTLTKFCCLPTLKLRETSWTIWIDSSAITGLIYNITVDETVQIIARSGGAPSVVGLAPRK
jgi:hypothetical protein